MNQKKLEEKKKDYLEDWVKQETVARKSERVLSSQHLLNKDNLEEDSLNFIKDRIMNQNFVVEMGRN